MSPEVCDGILMGRSSTKTPKTPILRAIAPLPVYVPGNLPPGIIIIHCVWLAAFCSEGSRQFVYATIKYSVANGTSNPTYTTLLFLYNYGLCFDDTLYRQRDVWLSICVITYMIYIVIEY